VITDTCVMKVWIDPEQCIGNGICEELCPEVFVVRGGIALVRDGMDLVPGGLEDAVIDAAEACPAECIYVEVA